MCEPRAADSNLKVCHSAECLINGEDPNYGRSLRANSSSMVKSRIMLFSRESDKNEPQGRSIPYQNCDCQNVENFERNDVDSLVEWSLDSSDDENTGCTNRKQTSSYVSHEELRVLTGCVTRGRVLFSPKSSQETSPSVLQVVPASASDEFEGVYRNHCGSPECDNHKGNPLTSSASNPIPDSVSVQFDLACYDSETICESSLKRHQLRHTGLNVAAVSRSEYNIDIKSADSKRQCLVGTPLSCSIPSELNTCSPQFDHRTRQFPRLEQDSSPQFLLRHAKDNSLHGSWPCRHLYHCKGEQSTGSLCSCSVKHAPHTSSVPHQVTPLQLAKQRSFNTCFPSVKGNLIVKSSLSSSLDIGSTLSVSSYHSASDPLLSLSDRPHISYSTGVDGQAFKDKTEVSFKIVLHMLCYIFLSISRCFLHGLRNSVISKEICSYRSCL